MLDLGLFARADAVFAACRRSARPAVLGTFSDAIRAMAGQLLRDPLSIQVSPRNSTVKSVKQWMIPVDKKRKAELFCHLLKKRRWGQVLVFVKTRKGVDQLVATLLERGIRADAIHGDKTQPNRLRALARFKAGECSAGGDRRGGARPGISTTCRRWSISTCRRWRKTISTASAAPDGPAASGEAVSLVCADEVELLAALEALTRQTLKRIEEAGFEAEHRVPATARMAAVGQEAGQGALKTGADGKPSKRRFYR